MSGYIVVEGAVICCSKGSISSTMIPIKSTALRVEHKNVCMIDDNRPGINFNSFCRCSVANLACEPDIAAYWSSDVGPILGSETTLTWNSMLLCKKGGIITILNPGQNTTLLGLSKNSDLQIVQFSKKGDKMPVIISKEAMELIFSLRDQIIKASTEKNVNASLVAAIINDEYNRRDNPDRIQDFAAQDENVIEMIASIFKISTRSHEGTSVYSEYNDPYLEDKALQDISLKGSGSIALKDLVSSIYLSRVNKASQDINASLENITLHFPNIGSMVEDQTLNKISLGISQMRIGELKNLVRDKYIEPPDGWDEDQNIAAIHMLESEESAPLLIAARLRRTIDYWGNASQNEQHESVDISQKYGVQAFLYSSDYKGQEKGVHRDPDPGERGREIEAMRSFMEEILGE